MLGRHRLIAVCASVFVTALGSTGVAAAQAPSCLPDCAGANLQNANLSTLTAYQADFSGANLSGANLQGADLESANLTGANLAWANLTGANLQYANLYQAVISSANLTGATLTGATTLGWTAQGVNWGSAINYDQTVCSDGSIATWGCPAVAGSSPPTCASGACAIPGLIDPDFAALPRRPRLGSTLTLRFPARGWPQRKAPCTAAGTGRRVVSLAQGGRVFVWPLQRLGGATLVLGVPSAAELRRAGIDPARPAQITTTVLGCAERPTYFGRTAVRFRVG